MVICLNVQGNGVDSLEFLVCANTNNIHSLP